MTDNTGFLLSRIFAEGWNAANKLSTGECDQLDREGRLALNPYANEPQRDSWDRGFTEALK